MIRKYAEIFCWKNGSSFCSAKATHIFSAKNIRILYIESAKIVNEMTLNELVKLTTLWTTGPRTILPNVTVSSYFWYNKNNRNTLANSTVCKSDLHRLLNSPYKTIREGVLILYKFFLDFTHSRWDLEESVNSLYNTHFFIVKIYKNMNILERF